MCCDSTYRFMARQASSAAVDCRCDCKQLEQLRRAEAQSHLRLVPPVTTGPARDTDKPNPQTL